MTSTFNQLIHKIDDFIRRYYLNKIVRGSIWWVAIFLFSYLLFIVSEYYSYFNTLIRSLFFYGFILIQLLLLWFLIIRYAVSYLKLGKVISHEKASEIIGNHFPEIKDKLINTLQLKQLAEEKPEQKALIEASINQRVLTFKPVPFANAVDISANKKYLSYALIPIAIVIVLAFAAPSILADGTSRIIHHQRFYKKKAPFEFNILNKTLVVAQGEDLLLDLKLTGDEIPEEVFLQDGVNTFKLDKKNIINFSYQFKNLQHDKKFRFQAGSYISDEFLIEVKKKPAILSYSVSLNYPAYTGRKSEIINNPGDLTVPIGTSVKWNFNTAYADMLKVTLGQKTFDSDRLLDNRFSASSRLMQSAKYSLIVNNTESQITDTMSYQIQVVADEYPKIEAEERKDSANVNVLYFVGNASDDYGLSSLKFHYQIAKSDDKQKVGKSFSVSVPINKGKIQSNFFHLWQLKELGIVAGDELSYYFEVTDNDGISGPKRTKTTTRIYKLPSKNEQFDQIEEKTDAIKDKMQQALKKADQIQKEAKKLNQDLFGQKSLDYEQKKRIQELTTAQKDLEKLIKEIQKDGKQNMEQSKDLQLQNKELLEKQKQIQDLFENVLDNKTKELLENLQKLMDQNEKAMSQEELNKMQMDNKSLKKELDRILELYKKLAVEQKLNNTIDKLSGLAEKQKELSEQNQIQKDDAQKKQKDVKKEFDDIKKDLKDVAEKNELLEKPENLDMELPNQKEIDKNLDKAEQNLQQNKKQDAARAQKSAAAKMEELAEKLKKSMQSGQAEENQVNERQLKMILKNLLKSSFDQEEVLLKLKQTDQNDPNFLKLGQKQIDIKENLKIVEDSLYSLSKKVPQIQTVVNKEIQAINHHLNSVLEQFTERKIVEANKSQQYALTSINNLALMLSEALQQLQNAMKNAQPGGKGKTKPGLSELSEMQKQLNKNMQKAKEGMQKEGIMPGQKGSRELSESLAKMAQQQQMIRQALQEVNKNLNKDGSGSLGDLEKILKQMEQTETDLVNRRITEEAIQRQQEIQTRLLEAEKAEREREQDDKRESKVAKEFYPNYNLILKEYQNQKTNELQQLKTVPPTLNYFYKTKITEYFKSLNLGE